MEHVLVKGPTLQVLYPHDVVRAAGDLDLLTHEEDVDKATAALGQAGFILQTPVPEGLTTVETVRYCHAFEQLRFLSDDGAEVELHFRPSSDSVACWEGSDVNTRAGIGLEELFLYLVSHLNLHNFGRILWYYDVAEFYGTWQRHIEWAELTRIARERRLGVSFYCAGFSNCSGLSGTWNPDSTCCAPLAWDGRPSTGRGVATRFSPWPPGSGLSTHRATTCSAAIRRFARRRICAKCYYRRAGGWRRIWVARRDPACCCTTWLAADASDATGAGLPARTNC